MSDRRLEETSGRTAATINTSARIAALFAVLVVAWLLWSWLFKPLVLVLGALSCVLVVYIVYRMDYFRSEHFALRFGPRFVAYWVWLIREIFASSIAVARIILSPDLPISPRTIDIKSKTDNPISQTIYANSITLTPGTLALDVHEGVIKVHTLTQDAADELMSGAMERRVSRLGID